MMELIGLENAQHARNDVVPPMIDDHRPSSLMNKQDFNSLMGVEGFLEMLAGAVPSICKIKRNIADRRVHNSGHAFTEPLSIRM
ncbi:hypothetical protein D3C78_1003950 [compost metagenome]